MSNTAIVTDVSVLNDELDNMVLQGKALEAFEKFYADDVVMQENSGEPFVGKELNRRREEEFFGSIQEFHGAELRGSAASGDRSYSEWMMEVTFKGGYHKKLEQVAARTWVDGKIVTERFYYNEG